MFPFRALIYILIIASLTGCSKDEQAQHLQVYNVRIADAYDVPFSNIPVTLTYNMGCTYYGLDESSTTTDATGRAQFATHMHPDTIADLLERNNWDNSVIFQGVQFEYDENEYYLYNYVQNDEEVSNQFRPPFKENDEVTIRMIKRADLKIELDDYSFDGVGLQLDFILTGSKGVTTIDRKYSSIFFNTDERMTHRIPGSADLHLEWELYEIDQESNLTLKKSGTIQNLNISEGQSSLHIIQ